MKYKLSVLIIDNSQYVTGALKSILNFSLYAKEKYNFIFILPNHSRATDYVINQGFEVIHLPFIEVNRRWRSIVLYFPMLLVNGFKVYKIAQDRGVSIIHVNDLYNMTGIVAKILGGSFKLLAHVRFMPDRFPAILLKTWIGINLRYAETVICVSKAVKELLPTHPKIYVIYNSIPKFTPNFKKEIKERDEIILLYLANYIPGKGQNFALEAFALAHKQNTKLRLRFVGGGIEIKRNSLFKEELINRTKVLKIEDAVAFLGSTSNVKDEILNADIVLNFSESESFSMTCLEALSLGTPLIATDCGGPSELFVHKHSGWLVKNRDIQAMSEAIVELSNSLKLRALFNENSIREANTKFIPEVTLSPLVAIYDKVLKS